MAKKGSQRSDATSTTSAPVDFKKYQGQVFRAFSTAHPTQELLDDLVTEPKERDGLKGLYYLDEISPAMSPTERTLRRSDQKIIQDEISRKFKPENWYASRYSDGSWGVLYSAEEESTALHECLFHKRKFYWEELKYRSLQIDLRIAILEVRAHRCIDFTLDTNLDHHRMVSKDESGYPYCQNLAKNCRERGAQTLRTPSARNQDGVCIPIFDQRVIHLDKGHIKYSKCNLTIEAAEIFEGGKSFKF